MNSFQKELSETLRVRRERQGLYPNLEEETESGDDDEDDDYEDDFEDDELVIQRSTSKPLLRPKNPSKHAEEWNLPSYLKDDDDEDDDILGGHGSTYYKKQEKRTFNKTPFDPLGMERKGETEKKSTIFEEDSESGDDDTLLRFLKDGKKEDKKDKQPTPAKRSKPLDSEPSESLTKRSFSPELEYPKRSKNPDGEALPVKGRKSPIRGSAEHSMQYNEQLRKSLDSALLSKRTLEKQRQVSSESRPKTPLSGKQSPELKGILETMKSKETPDVLSTERQSRVKKDLDQSQSFVDFLLDPSQPKPAPRKKGSKSSSVDSESRKSPLTRSLSPTISQNKDKKDSILRKSLAGEMEQNQKLSPMRSLSPQHDKQILSTSSLPSVQPRSRSLTAHGVGDVGAEEKTIPKSTSSPPLRKSEREKSKSDADDLLALFNQAVKDEPVDFQAHIQQKQEDKTVKTPLDDVVQKTAEQKTKEAPRQRSSRQLLDNIIENVAQHNDGSESSTSTVPENQKKTRRTKSGKKSCRTPPTGYQGLGSLSMLKELKKGNSTLNETKEDDVNTDDIRKKIYLEWLAKREEEKKKKKKEEEAKKKEEQEKIKSEKEEKEKENIIVRKKWEDVKLEQEKKKAKLRNIESKKEKEKQKEKDLQKQKSAKDAEKRRQQMLESAKISHHAEMRKKREAEREQKKKEIKQKKDNEKAVETWMDKRSEKWVEDRKKEQRDKHIQQKKEKKKKEEDAKEAEDRYNTWREKKDNQVKTTMRETRLKQRRQDLHFEEDEENFRPPWSPPNKVIPRRR